MPHNVEIRIKESIKKLQVLQKFLAKYPIVAKRAKINSMHMTLYSEYAPKGIGTEGSVCGVSVKTKKYLLYFTCWDPENATYIHKLDPEAPWSDIREVLEQCGLNFSAHELAEGEVYALSLQAGS